jgi:hypothetical protein
MTKKHNSKRGEFNAKQQQQNPRPNLANPFEEMARVVEGACSQGIPGSVSAAIGVTPWGEDEKRWFDANPHRRFRLRRTYPGEATSDFPRMTSGSHILAQRMQGGVLRVLIGDASWGEGGARLLDTLPDDDAVLGPLWLALRDGPSLLHLEMIVDAMFALVRKPPAGWRDMLRGL